MTPVWRRLLWAAMLSHSVALTAAPSETTFGDWLLRCENAPAGAARQCIMVQNLLLKAGGQPVLQFSIGMAPGDGTPTALISLPLGISLPPGISLRIDEGDTANFPVERCEPDGCQAGMHLRKETIQRLAAGMQMEITFYDGERQPITMPLSLQGFGTAFKAMQEASGQP